MLLNCMHTDHVIFYDAKEIKFSELPQFDGKDRCLSDISMFLRFVIFCLFLGLREKNLFAIKIERKKKKLRKK